MDGKERYEKYAKPYRKRIKGAPPSKRIRSYRGKSTRRIGLLCLGRGCENTATWAHGDYCSDECRDSVINELREMNRQALANRPTP